MSNKIRDRIIFNGKPLPNFVDVIGVKTPILPQFEIINNKIVWKEKPVEIEIAFNKRGLIKPQDELELIKWVKGDNFKPSKLFLYNDHNNYYLARLSENLDIDGLKRGKTSIKLICEDPFKYAQEYTTINYTANTFDVPYNGTEGVYPTLEINVIESCEEIEIHFKNKEYDNYTKIVGSFNSNDVIILSQYNNRITINDLPRQGIWTIDSKRHKLLEGNNRYEVKKGNINVSIKYQEINL